MMSPLNKRKFLIALHTKDGHIVGHPIRCHFANLMNGNVGRIREMGGRLAWVCIVLEVIFDEREKKRNKSLIISLKSKTKHALLK